MNKSLRKIMAFALVLVMAFTTFGPIAMAQSVQPTHEALINEYYREDHGSLSLKFEDCFKTYSVSLKVQDDKGNLLGYHIGELTDEQKEKIENNITTLPSFIKGLIEKGLEGTVGRHADDYVFKLYRNDGATEEYIAEGSPNEFGILTFTRTVQNEEGKDVPAEFAPGQYIVKQVVKTLVDDPDIHEVEDEIVRHTFTIEECKEVDADKLVVTVPSEKWCMSVRTVKDGFLPVANKKVSLYRLVTEVQGNNYVYKLDENKNYIVDEKLADITTNEDGYADLLSLNKVLDGDYKQVIEDGFRMWELKINGTNIASDLKIKEGERLGLVAEDGEAVFMVDPWKVVKVDRVYDRDIAIWPDYVHEPNCYQESVTIPFESATATLRVRVYHADATPQKRLPVPGAVIGLYKNASKIWGPIEAGEELARGTTDENGVVEFRNVPLSEILKYFGPVTNNVYLQDLLKDIDAGTIYDNTPIIDLDKIVTDGSRVVMPYLFKQLSAPEGFTFDADQLYPVLVSEKDLNNTKFLEIPNYKDSVGRLSGTNRYGTAVEIAEELYPNGPEMFDNHKNIVVASGDNFADALVGGVLASQYRAPLLLTEKGKLSDETKAYIEKYSINRAIVLGGEYSISSRVLDELNDAGASPSRVYGQNRAATAVDVGSNVIKLLNDGNEVKFNKGFTNNGRVYLAYEGDFADALTASVPAAEFGTPILLTATNKLSPETAKALRDWNVREVVIIGGENSVSKSVFDEVQSINGIVVHRYSGINRADTAMEVAKHYYHQSTFAYVASGQVYADALTGAPLAAKNRTPILLVERDNVPERVGEYIANNNITQITILGGSNTVSNAVRAQLNAIMVPAGSGITTSN